MATINVDSAGELTAAVRSASAGDTILLASGNYGELSLSGRDFNLPITIRSANGDGAVFSHLEVINMSGVTISDVTFQGSGTGMRFSTSENVTIQNSSFSGFTRGIQYWNVDDLDILNNDLRNITYDGIVGGHVQGLLIQGNRVEMNSNPSLDNHKDTIQIYNLGTVQTTSDVVIRNNTLIADDNSTHGIYFDNRDYENSGNRSEFYQDVLIENNTLRTSQVLGIAAGETDGLTIRNNVVLENADTNSRPVPVIRVKPGAVDVTITGNTTHEQPVAAAGNWQPTNTPGSWNISNNNIVPIGSGGSAPPASGGSGGGSTGGGSTGGGGSAPPPADDLGNGRADTFRFDLDRRQTVTRDVDFLEGDRVVLFDADRGTFQHRAGGNPLEVTNNGTRTVLDSTADVSELDERSSRVTTDIDGDDLVLIVRQGNGTHSFTFEDIFA
jgi:Right handed beta helix region